MTMLRLSYQNLQFLEVSLRTGSRSSADVLVLSCEITILTVMILMIAFLVLWQEYLLEA